MALETKIRRKPAIIMTAFDHERLWSLAENDRDGPELADSCWNNLAAPASHRIPSYPPKKRLMVCYELRIRHNNTLAAVRPSLRSIIV